MYGKRYKGGEDSFLVSANRRLIGVADGVGGWANRDVCSGVCAKFLCKAICDLFNSENELSLHELLNQGVKALQEARIEGSTTLCAAKLEPFTEGNQHPKPSSATIKVLNLGDSGCLIVRPHPSDLQKVYRT